MFSKRVLRTLAAENDSSGKDSCQSKRVWKPFTFERSGSNQQDGRGQVNASDVLRRKG